MNINVFLLFFSFVFLHIKREREREWYIKLGIRRNSPKVTYLIFRRGSTGESFLFYGLIDFMLFLTLAWRKWLLRVLQNFFVFFYPEYLAFGSVSYEPCPTTNFFFSFFRRREEGATSVLGSQPIIWLLSPPPLVSGDLSEVTKYQHLLVFPWPTFFLNGHSLTACYC